MKCDKSAILGLIILIGFFIILSMVFVQNKKLFNDLFNNKEGFDKNKGTEKKPITNMTEYDDYMNSTVKKINVSNAADAKSRGIDSNSMFDGEDIGGGGGPIQSKVLKEDDDGNIVTENKDTALPLEDKPLVGDNKKCQDINSLAGTNDNLFCKALVDTKCGMCLNPDEGVARAMLGNKINPETLKKTFPITDVCQDIKNWTTPRKDIESECRKQLDRLYCSEVPACDKMTTKQKSLCAWCPVEGKAFVYDKNHKSKWEKDNNHTTTVKYYDKKKKKTVEQKLEGEYVPKYPKLDSCNWPKVTLDNGKEINSWLGWSKGKLDKTKGFSGPMITGTISCKKLKDEFPCLVPGVLRKGIHSDKCKDDMWKNSGCDTTNNGGYRNRYNTAKNEFGEEKMKIFQNIEKSKNQNGLTFEYSYIDMYNTMRKFPNKATSRDYDEARLYRRFCYNKDTDPCDDKYKNADSNPIVKRPDDCLNKLWKDSKCTNGRYAPQNYKTYQNKGQLRNTQEYDQILYKEPSKWVKTLYQKIFNNSDKFEKTTTEEKLKDPTHMDQSIFWQESCHGKLTDKTKKIIKDEKPCWNDFVHIMSNAHDIDIKENEILFRKDPIGIKNTYMSDNNQIRSVMLGNKNGQNWGSNKNITKEMYEKPNFPYWKFFTQSETIYNSLYTLQHNGNVEANLVLTENDCKNFAKEKQYIFKKGNWSGDPPNCMICKKGMCPHKAEQNMVFWNSNNNSNNCGKNSYSCVRKIGDNSNIDKMTWDEFKLILAGDGKKLKDFENVTDDISVRQKNALEKMEKEKKFGIGGVTSPAPNIIVMEKRTDFTRIMNLYQINPKWSASRPVNGKCPDCSLVACGQCQEGCSKGNCPTGSKNNCINNNEGKSPTRCDVPEGNVITKNMFLYGYGPNKKQFPYWEFIKIAKRMGQKPFQQQ